MTTSIHIGIPTLDGKMEQPCLIGLLQTWTRYPCAISLPRGCYIGRNRDIITAEFLAGDCTHVLYLDADIAWSAEDLAMLLELDVDFACGLYPYKGTKQGPVARGLWHERERTIGEGHRISVERVGGGFVLCSRAAIVRMVERCPGLAYVDPMGRRLHGLWWTEDIVDGVVEGEDYAFCRRWHECGGDIVTRSDVALGHVGSMTYR